MAERLTYEPREIVDAAKYVREQTVLLKGSHAANWRKKFIGFVDEMTLRFEGLKLLTSLLNGNRNVDVGRWFEAAMNGQPPPLPASPYDAMSLVWQQVSAAVKKQGEGFFVTNAAVDLPYVLTSAFPGGSLGEKFWVWSEAYLVPFADHLCAWLDRIVARLPVKGSVDLWDLAVEVVNATGAAASPAPASDAATAAPGPAARGASGAKRSKGKSASKGTRKGPPVTSAKKPAKKARAAKKE